MIFFVEKNLRSKKTIKKLTIFFAIISIISLLVTNSHPVLEKFILKNSKFLSIFKIAIKFSTIGFLIYCIIIKILIDQQSLKTGFFNFKSQVSFKISYAFLLLSSCCVLLFNANKLLEYLNFKNKIIDEIEKIDEKFSKYIFFTIVLLISISIFCFGMLSYRSEFYLENYSGHLLNYLNNPKTDDNIKNIIINSISIINSIIIMDDNKKKNLKNNIESLQNLLVCNQKQFKDELPKYIKTNYKSDKNKNLIEKILSEIKEIYNFSTNKENKKDSINENETELVNMRHLLNYNIS